MCLTCLTLAAENLFLCKDFKWGAEGAQLYNVLNDRWIGEHINARSLFCSQVLANVS